MDFVLTFLRTLVETIKKTGGFEVAIFAKTRVWQFVLGVMKLNFARTSKALSETHNIFGRTPSFVLSTNQVRQQLALVNLSVRSAEKKLKTIPSFLSRQD